ncbi:MAG: hypothetical protein M3Q70_00730 [bacterium]|nr:hypothetical protein [bacterium]
MTANKTLFEDVVEVTYEYLGPAADRFISRQIRNHINKEPDQLRQGDLNKLIDWLRISMAMITKDDSLVAKYISTLERMAANGKHRRAVNAKNAAA